MRTFLKNHWKLISIALTVATLTAIFTTFALNSGNQLMGKVQMQKKSPQLEKLGGKQFKPPSKQPTLKEKKISDTKKRSKVPPLIPKVSTTNSIEHGDQHTEGKIPLSGNLVVPGPMAPNSTTTSTCTSQDVVGLSPIDLKDYLQNNSYNCLNFLWSFDANLQTVLTDAHMSEVLNTAMNLTNTYTGIDTDNLRELIFFTRAAYYHQFYQTSLNFSTFVDQAATNTFTSFSQNVNFNALDTDTENIMYEWINGIDAAEMSHLYYNELYEVLSDYDTNASRWGSSWQDNNAYSAMYVVFRAVTNSNTQFINQIDPLLISTLENIALNTNLIPNSDYVVNQAIYTLGYIATIPAHQTQALQALSDIFTALPYLSQQYLWVLQIIDQNGLPCPILSINICKPSIVPIVETMVFPYQYNFDDTTMVVHTSLPLTDVQPLYHAIKEVQGQFNRITETILPVQNDPNGILTIRLYGTMQEYWNYQWFLYNLPINNGGIYIEQDGIFYTCQRTASQSIYSLEELFRHEYVHYLVGRYLIQGFWGTVPIYSGDRMVWFDEGLAEFLAWSMQTGINTRQMLISQIASDGTNRMTINQIVNTSYGNFIFYRYAGMLFNYLYANDKDTLRNLLIYAHESNIVAFDSLINQMANDPGLEISYQNYLDQQIANISNLSNPFTIFPNVNNLDLNDPTAVEQIFQTTQFGHLGECSVAAMSLNSRFSCRGTLTGPLSITQDYVVAWSTFNAQLNQIINELQGSSNNFEAMQCRMGYISFPEHQGFPGQYYPLTEYYCDGPLGSNSFSLLPPTQQIPLDFQSTRLGQNTTCGLNTTNDIVCNNTLTTQLYTNSVNNTVLEQALEDALIELQSSVYAIRPNYYNNFNCTPQNTPQLIQYTTTEKYMLQNVECIINT